LEYIDHELVMQAAGDYFIAGGDDRPGWAVGYQFLVAIGNAGRLFDDTEARMKAGWARSPEMGKFSIARWVWAPQ
jgi:hypothetical protein